MEGSFAVGRLVEVYGLPDVLEEGDLLGTTDGSELAAYRPNGKRGKVVDIDPAGKRVVETFDAMTLAVSRDNLKEYTPDVAEEGGFDLAWPGSGEEATADFAIATVETIMKKGYCVVQMSMSEETRQDALKEANHMKYQRMKKEFEPAYLGRQYKCKTAWLEELAETKEEVSNALDRCDLHLSTFTKLMLPIANCSLGFMPYSRTSAMVRMPYQNSAEEGKYEAEELTEDDIEDGLVDAHIHFVKRKALCMLLVIETGGGELTLIPKDETKDNTVLEIAKGRMIIFPHDKMSYIYNPFDTSDLILQSWILQEPDNLSFVMFDGDQGSKDEALGIHVGPQTPDGQRVNVFGLGIGVPCGAYSCNQAYWCAVASGTDGQVHVPFTRFDMDMYSRSPDDWYPGTSYAVHGGFVSEDIYAIDNKIFGITDEEASIMAPAHRQLLEKGYESLYRSGYTQATLRGRKIGVFVGHSGDDWSFTQIFTCGYEDQFRMGHQSRVWGSMAGRLAYVLGMKGPQALSDTACSSALVAYGVGHTMLRKKEVDQVGCAIDNRLDEAVMCGVNLMPGPGNFINLCGPHMLSPTGRCYTFDSSADGFARGEGIGSFYVKNEDIMSRDTFATVIGACLNQDGRSASMTAPNGPAQQECIRGSMQEAGLSANQVTCAECHGTGTALGDPIEVGALRGVMQDRVVPILQTSSKAHCGHLEASAGTAGIMKCMLMCAATAGTPNCHLYTLNPHLDVAGYPASFTNELTDYGYNAGYSGVSSFGFGGANSRADVFAKSSLGAHSTGVVDWKKVDYVAITCPFDEGPMHYTDGRMVPKSDSKNFKHEAYHADAIRSEFASYDYNSSLYEGDYQLAPGEEYSDDVPTDPIYIVGSWDAFREDREMEPGDEEGTWTFTTVLGESRCERFQLQVNKHEWEAIYPAVNNGTMRTRVMGPDEDGKDKFWMMDLRDERVPAGTVYRITLKWGEPPQLRWEQVTEPVPDWATSIRHTYSILGSWTGGSQERMTYSQDDKGVDIWEARLRIGLTNMEWFRFARDKDTNQEIYPAKTGCSEDTPVCGPDNMCNDKFWRVGGKTGEIVTVRLQIVDAHVTVTVLSNSMGTRTMQSTEGARHHSYHISGTFNNWRYEEMQLDPDTLSTFKYKGTVGDTCQEYFYISTDADAALSYYPEANGARYPGDSLVVGPRPTEEGRLFSIFCLKAGAEFEITFNRHTPDKRRIVDVNWVDGRVDSETMKTAFYNFFNMGMVGPGMLADSIPELPVA